MATTGNTGRGYDHLPEHRRRIYQGEVCHDFDDLLDQALAHGKDVILSAWPDGTPIADAQDAWQLLGKLANCKHARQNYSVARNQNAGLGPVQLPDGTWAARFRVLPKDQGREHITARREAGEQLTFNPAAPKTRSRGKYICRTAMGGCGHRRAPEPEALCDDCAVRRTGQHGASYEITLATHRPGDGTPDVRIWMIEHGHTAPRSTTEQKVRTDYLDYLAQARAARHQAEQAQQDTGQTARGIVRTLLDAWKHG